MNSRTSFFNKSLIRSDLRRLWWISALHTIGIFLFYTFLYLDQYTGEYGYLPTGVYTDFGTSPIYRMSPAFYVLAILVPVGLSAFLFSYLQNNSSMTCLHGIPVSRKTHYFSHLLSGGIMLLIPVLVNGLILLLFRMNKNVAESYRIVDLFWLLASGIRKRDYPPAMYYQQPWWKEFKKFIDVTSRICCEILYFTRFTRKGIR